MAQFRPRRVSNDEALNNLPILEGQFIVVEETEEIYFDRSSSERIPLGSAQGVGTSLFLDGKTTLQLKDKESNVLSEVNLPVISNAILWNNESIDDIGDLDGTTTWDIAEEDREVKFQPIMTINANNINKKAGQLIYDETAQALYIDIDGITRKRASVDAYTKQEIDDIMGDVVSLMEQL